MIKFTRNLLKFLPYDQNVLVSPMSMSSVLLRNIIGANGKTREEMLRVMGMNPGATDDYIMRNALGAEKLLVNGGIQAANRLYLDSAFALNPTFQALATQNGGMERMPFSVSPDWSREQINTWVLGKTNQKIPNLLPEGSIDLLTKMVLVNALYLKFKWLYMYDEELTHLLPFMNLNGDKPNVPFMTQKNNKVKYMHGHRMSAILMPYQGTEMVRLYVVPHQGVDLAKAEYDLLSTGINHLIDQMERTPELTIYVPKHVLEYGTENMIPYLELMGMNLAFTNDADFSRMEMSGKSTTFISGVYHKTWMEDNEEGSEMAAGTGSVSTRKSGLDGPVFAASKPFLFYNLLPYAGTYLPVFAGRRVNFENTKVTRS